MPAKIPTTVVTGFLGAGKTTLIRNMIANAEGRRIALIVNEFGDLGIDGELLRGCGPACADEDIVELSNGCICCTVAEDFVPTMEKLLARELPPDAIVIETSGLALPQPLVRAFSWPGLATRVTVDGVIAVVDARALADGRFAHEERRLAAQRAADPTLDHETPLAELFEDQLACADLVVLNKTDLLSEAELEALAGTLRAEVREGSRVVPSRHGTLPLGVLLGLDAAAEDNMATRVAPHHEKEAEEEHDHDEFESFVVSRGALADPAAFARQVAETIRAHDVLRLKGFAAVEGKPMRLAVQAVGPRVETYYDRPLGPGEGTRLVVIGETGMDRTAITQALSQ